MSIVGADSFDLEPTPELESVSIIDALARIGSREEPLLLPAIQRHFVWDSGQICDLFDSILKGYPIGTFLFWEIEDEERDNYAFYEFMRDYSEHPEKRYNPPASRHLPRGVTGVLDGQQRLNSMLVALCGSYWKFIGGQGYHTNRESSYLQRTLYLDLHHVADEEESSKRFAFLTREEAAPENWRQGRHWFPVDRTHPATTKAELSRQWKLHLKQLAGRTEKRADPQEIPQQLRLLHQRIHEERLVRYFPIRRRGLTEALDIFIRANNGGVEVSAAEMIFATIIAHWPEGRNLIEKLQRDLNSTGNGFSFDISRVLLGILSVGGLTIRLKIESFRPSAVDQIRDDFVRVTKRLLSAAELLDRWGLSGNNAINPNALIALALLLDREIDGGASDEDLRQFIIRSLLCEFYRRPETPLRQICEYGARHLSAGSVFQLRHMEEHFILPSGRTLIIGADLLEELLMVPIHDRRCYVLLALIHPHHAQHQHQFHKDHLHPRSRFDGLNEFGLSPDEEAVWRDWRDRLPNLQLLQGDENNHKRAKPLRQWVESEYSAPRSRGVFLDQNDIPLDQDLDFRNFPSFFQTRKERLRARLRKALNITAQEPAQAVGVSSS